MFLPYQKQQILKTVKKRESEKNFNLSSYQNYKLEVENRFS